MQREERWEGIGNSRYNKGYKEIKEEGLPEYLRKGWGESRWRIIRFRMNNEMKGARYWEEEKKRRCRLCGMGEETWEHVLGECRGNMEEGRWDERMKEILRQGGEGERWVRELEVEREGSE